VGGLLAGILLGPAALGWIQPNELQHAFSELGVMLLLFHVGLQVSAKDLKSVGMAASFVAVGGVAVPLVAGWAILTASGASQVTALFTGAAMVATSVGITAQVLQSAGLLHLSASRVILAAAVIDDILGLIVLAAVSSMARGSVNVLELFTTAGLAVMFVVAAVQLGARAAQRLAPRARETMQVAEAEYALAMTLLFALALLAVYAGVAAIIGAFLAGMMIADAVGERVKLMAGGAAELFVPFFLAGIGLNLDLKVFADPGTLKLALAILAAAIVSKLVGCGLAAYRMGRVDAIRVGVGMIPRGEVGMVVAQIGLGLGVIAANVYAVVVFMSIATTMIAPLLLKLAFRGAEPVPSRAPEQMRIG
jgi:Kef-type K+ transport system membrane component KefB